MSDLKTIPCGNYACKHGCDCVETNPSQKCRTCEGLGYIEAAFTDKRFVDVCHDCKG